MDQENTPPVPVVNPSLLLSAFGYFPTFHDGEVHRALLDRGGSGEPPSVTLVMHAFDIDDTVDEKGVLPCDDERSRDLRFDDVRESELRDLGLQNVLSSQTSNLMRADSSESRSDHAMACPDRCCAAG